MLIVCGAVRLMERGRKDSGGNMALIGAYYNLKAKRKSGSVKFLSNEKEYTILSLFSWVEGGEEV